MEHPHAPLLEDLVRHRGVVLLIGRPNTGKSTFARKLLAAAQASGKDVAYVDAEVDQSTTGPPACVGLKVIRTADDLANLHRADALEFVGSIAPDGVVLQQVVATGKLVNRVRDDVDLVVIDTSGVISGVVGQTLKYHKMELCRPDVVVGIQRGSELEPMVGMLRRFFSADVEVTKVDPDIEPSSPEERTAHRAKGFERALAPPLSRWRVRDTVFAPTLPAGLDPARLDGTLVGLMDSLGQTLGLGVLEYDGELLRVTTNAGEGMRGLRLGSLHMDLNDYSVRKIRLRELMFGLS